MRRGGAVAAALFVAALSLGSAIALQVLRDRAYPRAEATARAVLYVRSDAAVRRMVLSFDALAADIYWIRALQHYGGTRLRGEVDPDYDLLYPLLDLTTSLDPYFTIAYRFGAIFLSEAPPGGPGRPDRAIALLQKGITAEPAKWQYYHDIAFVHFWQLHDTTAAAEWFRRAAEQPDAPSWLEPVAASMLIKGGDRPSARFLLAQILQSEEIWLRRMASRALMQVDALDMIDELEAIVARYPPPPDTPYSWDRLVRAGILRRTPEDPSGTPFILDAQTGSVSVSPRSELSPMPTASAPVR